MKCFSHNAINGYITIGRELREQHPSDLLSGGGQEITRVLLRQLPTDRHQSRLKHYHTILYEIYLQKNTCNMPGNMPIKSSGVTKMPPL